METAIGNAGTDGNATATPPAMGTAVVGAGALGTLVAARLAAAGAVPVLIGRRSEHLEQIQRAGVVVREPDGTAVRVRLRATGDPAAVGRARLVVVAVKTWATEEALAPLRPWLRSGTTILSLQNGLGNAERLRATLGASAPVRIVLGVTEAGAMRGEPGAVVVAGGGQTTIGDPARPVDDELRRIATLLSAAGLPTRAVDDVGRWIWRKLAVNAAINGVTALAGVPNGAVADDPELRQAARLLADEVAAVAQALGIDVGDAGAAMEAVARATAGNHSSMWRDVRAGTPTEVDAIHGAVVSEGERLGVATPATRLVAALLRSAARRDSTAAAVFSAAGRASASPAPLAADAVPVAPPAAHAVPDVQMLAPAVAPGADPAAKAR